MYVCVCASIYVCVFVCVWPHPTLPARSFQNHFKFNTKSQTMTKVVQDVRSVDREGWGGEWGAHILKIGMWRVKGKGKAFALIKNN